MQKHSNLENKILKLLNTEVMEERAKIPKKIMFELTNLCDLKCQFCSTHISKRKKGFMEFDFFKRVIDEAMNLGIEECALFTTGESFLHPEVMKFIDYSSQFDLYTYISTGGRCLSEELMDQILSSGLKSIKFSIDAGNEETYKIIKGCDVSLDNLHHTIKYLYKSRNEMKSDLNIYGSYAISEGNENEIDKFMEKFFPIMDDVFFKFVGYSGLKLFKERKLGSELRKKYFIVENNEHSPCPLLWERFIVQLDGSLTICCPDYENQFVYGDLKKESLQAAWNNETIKSFRNEMIEGKYDKLKFCSSCEGTRSKRAGLLKEFNHYTKKKWHQFKK